MRVRQVTVFSQHSFISRPHGLTVPAIESAILIRLPEIFRGRLLFPYSGDPRHAAEGNPDPLPGVHEQRPAAGAAFGLRTTVLQVPATDQTALAQSSSRRWFWRATFGSRKAVLARDYAQRGRSSPGGFFEIYVVGDAGTGTGTLPGSLPPHHAREYPTKVRG